MAQPLFRIFKLGIEIKDLAAFRKVGQTNLLTSLVNEEGTWAMYACHEDEQGLANVVCELYQAEPAYQVHVNSAHFKRYLKETTPLVVSKQLTRLVTDTAISQALEINLQVN